MKNTVWRQSASSFCFNPERACYKKNWTVHEHTRVFKWRHVYFLSSVTWVRMLSLPPFFFFRKSPLLTRPLLPMVNMKQPITITSIIMQTALINDCLTGAILSHGNRNLSVAGWVRGLKCFAILFPSRRKKEIPLHQLPAEYTTTCH